jgi:hypothetical protein
VPSALAAGLLCSVCRPRKSVESDNSYDNSTMMRVILPGLNDPSAPTGPALYIEELIPLGLERSNDWADECMMLRVGTGLEPDLDWMNQNFDDRIACAAAMRAAHGMPPLHVLLMGPCMERAHRLRSKRLGGTQVDPFSEVVVYTNGGVTVLGDVHPTAGLYEDKKSKNVEAGHETQGNAQQVTLCSTAPPAPSAPPRRPRVAAADNLPRRSPRVGLPPTPAERHSDAYVPRVRPVGV